MYLLECDYAIGCEGKGEDDDKSSGGEHSGLLSNLRDVPEGSQLDEGSWEEEAMGQTNLHSTEQRGDTSAVCCRPNQNTCGKLTLVSLGIAEARVLCSS